MKPTRDGLWRKSSYSGDNNGACLEVRDDVSGAVPVRDSKMPHAAHLIFPDMAWQSFVNFVS
ncbi:DUF397 domain-containing protein [Streptomyces aidingensis]|uniref:DUF397 domain-containing protein n=1 Tax=Streptomyces aidingensis TaxID=910347 RepID=A0A1I1QVL3_9ACTN|nr:DUF397 domain-containing protein [Streptomyces aidingensis]SFD26184.1 protein of unknown function [Streptomyces aidingensis]